MDIEKLIEQLKNLEACAYGYHINGEVLVMDCSDFEQIMVDVADSLSTFQTENEKLRAELERTKNNAFDEAMRAAVQAADKVLLDTELSHVKAELEQVKRDFDGLCEYIDSEGFLRKQFCENGNPDLEPCICPSLQEHPGYIDSDDCEGCDHFCNSWRGTKEG